MNIVSSSFSSSSSSSSSSSASQQQPQRPRLPWPVVLVVVLLMLVSPVSSSTLAFNIEPKSQECFKHFILQDNEYEFLFEVIRGGLLDIKFRISDPNGATMSERLAFFDKDDATNEQEMKAKISAHSTGLYTVCFDNTMSRWTPKVVEITFLDDDDANKAGAELEIATVDNLGPVVDSVIAIAEKLDAIVKKQHHLRIREQSHRDHQATLNSRVQYLAILECLTLLGLSVFQVKYIRRWFAEKMQIGRV